ncbi:hypothetical protein [Variovorax sp. PAMC 28711]|uniref:hypothetical protein n=1 Tax=Variovorax sp. PAMC 28711 TaxID=1795631 RepID=UPI00078D6D58|nr:hypothetical protein [Variovorax sp. PAMC 28711]AMM24619.1 hypothetical protein AX767_09850 [Variovorax sp. PAMC 28711]
MVEIVLALLLVLIPVFVFGWALNGYGTARNLALSGARYAAWERTVWFAQAPTDSPLTGNLRVQKAPDQIQREMIDRVFATNAAPAIQSRTLAQAPALRNADVARSTMGYNRKNLLELERTAATNEQGARPTLRLYDAGTTTSTGVARVLESLSAVTSAISSSPRIDLEDRGIWRADVVVRPNALNISAVSDGQQTYLPFVSFSETAAAMGDPWNVGGNKHEVRRVEPLVPTNIFDNSLLDTIRNVIGLIVTPLKSSNLKPGFVDADRLPADRRK